MAPSPKSPRKQGTSKPKGAVRAKSGCYTCRIRRKKCDERANSDGDCETCVRLHLECLGFGAKRPEWLRETRNVAELREKIKTFLASQGMIKGTSGSGPRSSEREATVLRLNITNDYSSSSESPSTPVLVLSEPDFRPGLAMSSERDHPYQPLQHSYRDSPAIHSIESLGSESPYTPPAQLYGHDDMSPFAPLHPSHNLVSEYNSWRIRQHYTSPALGSNFSPLYASNCFHDDPDEVPGSLPPDCAELSPDQTLALTSGHTVALAPDQIYFPGDSLLNHYMNQVLKLQYMLADQPQTTYLMFKSTSAHPVALDAIHLLAKVHQYCMGRGEQTYKELTEQYKNVHRKLIERGPVDQGLIEQRPPRERDPKGEAIAGLQVVSSFLFRGGCGGWYGFLALATHYAKSTLRDPLYGTPSNALMECGDLDRYIIKTAMWFDVLASACQLTIPYFMAEYRDLFRPSAYIEGLEPDQRNMMSMMGCANHIVWAMAEVSYLSCWKVDMQRSGRLSMPELVEKGREIDKHLLRSGPMPLLPVRGGDTDALRLLTSEVFRSSTRVYLHSVISGDYPSCPEICDAVNQTIKIIHMLPSFQEAASAIRSVVFGVFICGCFTDDLLQRNYLMHRLNEQSSGVGNCSQVQQLMSKIWKERAMSPLEPVRWREALKEWDMLLV